MFLVLTNASFPRVWISRERSLSVPIENCTEVPTEIAHSGRLLSV